MADQNPQNQLVDRLSSVSRTNSQTEDVAGEQNRSNEETLEKFDDRGERYKQLARRQRVVNQRMRSLSNQVASDPSLRGPRNARFQNNTPKTERLNKTDIAKLVGVALFFDIISGIMGLIPIAGEVVYGVTVFPIATLTLFMMYNKRGIHFKEGKMLVRFWGSVLLKFIPVVAILPEYTLNVILIILATKTEDKLK